MKICTSIGCTCKARAASSSEKVNIDFVCEIVNFDSIQFDYIKKRSLRIRATSSSEKINIDFVCEIVNFDSPNLIILKKKKSKNTTKYHNIFTISSFLGSE